MKKILTSFLIVRALMFYDTAQSQTTNYYLDSTSVWYELFGGWALFNTYINHSKYYFNGDTIISGRNYYKLYRDGIDSTINDLTGNVTVNYVFSEYHGGLREDSLKRSYIFYPSQTVESFLFDFNLSVGDSLPNMISNNGCNNPPNTVTFIDTVYLGSQALKKFHFTNQPNKTLYEGIGASGGLVWSGSLCQAFESGACLIAYKKGLDSLYINCGLGTTGISETSNKNFINIFPNPATNEITIATGAMEIDLVEVNDMMGERCLTPTLSEAKGVRIDVSSLPAGIYFVAVTDEKGNQAVRKVVKM